MTEATTGKSNHSIIDFYELGDRPVAVNRISLEGWMWKEGSWQSGLSLAHRSHTEGKPMSSDDFARRFPDAALALLEAGEER
ncbi:MAG: hypothetical protein JKY36_04735 [Erythrobacter sp.]|nr:hypothetical protein [Erythrobacter sp.]